MNDSTTADISQRVTQIENKASQAEEIQERIDRNNEERQRADRKDRAFKKLKRAIAEIDNERERLSDWIELAREMEVEVEESSIQETLEQVRQDLETFAEREYHEFSDAAPITDLREETFEAHRDALQQHCNDVQGKVEEECESRKEQIKRTQTALRIPDLGEPGDSDQLKDVLQFLTRVENGELPDNAVQRWQRLENAYDEIELSLEGVQSRFELSDATLSIIRRFLDDETVMLAELDSEKPDTEIVTELQTFEEFSERLEVQFKEET